MKPVTFAAACSLALALTLAATLPQAQTAPTSSAPTLEQIFRAELPIGRARAMRAGEAMQEAERHNANLM